ncbi:hypothetical protein [Desulfocurvus sp. DL9XJH121]
MTLLFPDRRNMGGNIVIRCPRCKTEHRTEYAVKKRSAEVCPRCNGVYKVEVFSGGTVLVE